MTPLTKEWVDKAEGDFSSLLRDLRARKSPKYDGACFHGQQCVEKYLKARLNESAVVIVKTHDILALLTLCLPIEPLWSAIAPNLAALNPYGVRFRYPGDWADKEEAKNALKNCQVVREEVRRSLGLPSVK
jgi:HEPN domain-containing protein